MSFGLLWLLCLGSALGNDLPSAAPSTSIKETPVGRSSREEVVALPGLDDGRFESKHHAGYLTVDWQRRSHLYYYFVESENDPQASHSFSGSMSDPVARALTDSSTSTVLLLVTTMMAMSSSAGILVHGPKWPV